MTFQAAFPRLPGCSSGKLQPSRCCDRLYTLPETDLTFALQGKATANPGGTVSFKHPRFGNLYFALQDVLFREHRDYEAFAQRFGDDMSSVAGFWTRSSNVSVFFDQTRQTSRPLPSLPDNSTKLLNRSGNTMRPATGTGIDSFPLKSSIGWGGPSSGTCQFARPPPSASGRSAANGKRSGRLAGRERGRSARFGTPGRGVSSAGTGAASSAGAAGSDRGSSEGNIAAGADDSVAGAVAGYDGENGRGRNGPAPTPDDENGRSVTEDDLRREDVVREYVAKRLAEWQSRGWVPDMRIEVGGPPRYQGLDLIRARGWTHWHHVFNPRQLLIGSLVNRLSPAESKFALTQVLNLNSRLSRFDNSEGGAAATKGAFDNQALNTIFNYGARGTVFLQPALEQCYPSLSGQKAGTAPPGRGQRCSRPA